MAGARPVGPLGGGIGLVDRVEQLVAGQPAPRRDAVVGRWIVAADLEHLAAGQRPDVRPNERRERGTSFTERVEAGISVRRGGPRTGRRGHRRGAGGALQSAGGPVTGPGAGGLGPEAGTEQVEGGDAAGAHVAEGVLLDHLPTVLVVQP